MANETKSMVEKVMGNSEYIYTPALYTVDKYKRFFVLYPSRMILYTNKDNDIESVRNKLLKEDYKTILHSVIPTFIHFPEAIAVKRVCFINDIQTLQAEIRDVEFEKYNDINLDISYLISSLISSIPNCGPLFVPDGIIELPEDAKMTTAVRLIGNYILLAYFRESDPKFITIKIINGQKVSELVVRSTINGIYEAYSTIIDKLNMIAPVPNLVTIMKESITNKDPHNT